ncbi:MAG: hypothetical protein ACXVRV_13065 [Gaiellaceae bacterium]
MCIACEHGHQLRSIGLQAGKALEIDLELREVLAAHHRRHLAEGYEHLVVVAGGRVDLGWLHDRLEAVHHPLARGSLAGETQGERRDHEHEPDREHRPQQLAVHHVLLCLFDLRPGQSAPHPKRR